jgi:ribonuclease III
MSSGSGAQHSDAERRLLDALGVDLSGGLLDLALTHRSFAYENGGIPTNERLEFLGDSVLGLVITDALYRERSEDPEGRLAKVRAAVVNARALAGVAEQIGIGDCVRLGRGEEGTGGRSKSSILADTLEAVLGAVYLEYGFDTAGRVIHTLFDPLLAAAVQRGAGLDWKTSLQELTARAELGVPEYRIAESGPDHDKVFVAWVALGDREFDRGSGRSKKEAEQIAAEYAYETVLREYPAMSGDD